MNGRARPLDLEVLGRLTVDTEPWLSCDDCFDRVDLYVEMLLAGGGDDLAAMRAHLRGCPACEEEAAGLLLLAADDLGVDPSPALAGLVTGPARGR